MTTGTKSIIVGTHQFIVHPFFVLLGWIRFFKEIPPFKVWVAILVHDWGYWKTERIISKEGAEHPIRSAEIIRNTIYDNAKGIWVNPEIKNYKTWRVWDICNFIRNHGENIAERNKQPLSPLYFADKLGAIMTPIWLNSLLARLSGESKEYWDFLGVKISLRDFFKRYKIWVRASVASYLGEKYTVFVG